MSKIFVNYFYSSAFILFTIGFFILLFNSNLIKKIIGMNIMDTSVFLLFISKGYIRGKRAPILNPDESIVFTDYINPLPSALILTGIVVAVSVTAFLLALAVKLYEFYGTVDMEQINRIRRGLDGDD